MVVPTFRQAPLTVFALGVLLTFGAMTVCGEAGTTPTCAGVHCSRALAGFGPVTAGFTGAACEDSALVAPVALQSSDGDGAPAHPVSHFRLAGGDGVEHSHLSSGPVPHTFHDGTAVYLVVSSWRL